MYINNALAASKYMHEPLVPMLFPVLGAHISGAEFQHLDLSWRELCGQRNLLGAHKPLREIVNRQSQISVSVEKKSHYSTHNPFLITLITN